MQNVEPDRQDGREQVRREERPEDDKLDVSRISANETEANIWENQDTESHLGGTNNSEAD